MYLNNFNGFIILDFERGDVNGDNIIDNVFLLGKKSKDLGGNFITDISLIVQDGRTNKYTFISFKFNGGYNPKLYLGDFNKDKVLDALVSIDSGGSGRYIFSYIYSFLYNKPKEIFDFNNFNEKYFFNVIYKDYYRVNVENKDLNKEFTLDISSKGKDYLSNLYDNDGKLKEPVSGSAYGIVLNYPIDMEMKNMFELNCLIRIVGINNSDSLGYVQVILDWDGTKMTDKLIQVLIWSW